MIWKDIKDYEDLYQVSDEGQIFSIRTNRIIKDYKAGTGYRMLSLYKNGKAKKHYIHRLVAQNFLGFSDLEVNYKDGDKTNNHLLNLEWLSSSDNHRHAFKLGLKLPREIDGESNINNKLITKQAKEIYILTQTTKLRQVDIAKMYGVERSVIGRIKNKQIWLSIHKEDSNGKNS